MHDKKLVMLNTKLKLYQNMIKANGDISFAEQDPEPNFAGKFC